ncbi:bifunctional folylpolyglutamate synthase/dihydrofolate synthase [Porticoccaceae bacterium]|nr:bifunctional folylpolyglutamate synthase/dihydrofolate synthase [Porticoccaceae bacterium]
MPDRSLAEWLTLIESRHPSEIELGLGRVAEVWHRLLQQPRLNQCKPPLAITVAGTNGKGSCITSMQALLLQHGHSVGTFTSPHFLAYNERICLAGKPVSDALIVDAFEQIEAVTDELSLTYFEVGTLAALVIFYQASPDVMLMEVGLGGRLDAINIIDADIAVLTSIALDHCDWLGDTRTAIAREKLGIARPNRPLIIGEQDYPEGFAQLVADTGAKPLWAGRDFTFTGGELFDCQLSSPESPRSFEQLNGQGLLPINKILALQALTAAGFQLNQQDSAAALQQVSLTGRHQQLTYRGLEVILDVAHNPAAAKVLAASLAQTECRTIAVAAVLEDKDWSGIIEAMVDPVDDWILGEISDSSRARKGQSLLDLLYNAGQTGRLQPSVEQAFELAVDNAAATDRILVFGSFHTVAAVLKIILAEV